MPLAIESVAIESITPDPKNARRHPDRNLEAIKISLHSFKQQKPIVVSHDGRIIAGHGTYEAALSLGWKEIQIVRSDLSGPEITAYAIADNKTTDTSEWDFEQLSGLLRELKEQDESLLLTTGFLDFEIEPLLAADWTPPVIDDSEPASTGSHEKAPRSLHFDEDQWAAMIRFLELFAECRDGANENAETRVISALSEWIANQATSSA